MVVQSYPECFWGGDLSSTLGSEALVKRNHDGKKMCQELEDYLKKRAKLEYEFGKSLNNLAKCFKQRDHIGELEAAMTTFKTEIESMASSHHGASVFFTDQADKLKVFREQQQSQIKQIEDNLIKAQNSKLNQLSKTLQLEKTYTKKCLERDSAESNFKDAEREGLQLKDFEKAKSKYLKAEEDAQKSDNAYKTGVIVLENSTTGWEKAMETACQIVQEIDEERIRYLRQEMWTAVNVDSKLALDVDNCCESVRQRLERCDISQDIQAFLKSASTGSNRPKHHTFRHYTCVKDQDSDGDSTASLTDNTEEDKERKLGGTLPRKTGLAKFKSALKM